MLSRRNIRIKVMETLYQMGRDPELKLADGAKRYWSSINAGFNAYIYVLLNLVEVAKSANADLERRQKKLRPTDRDRKFTPRLYDNPATQSIYSSNPLFAFAQGQKLDKLVRVDDCETIYREFSKTESYIEYYLLEEPSIADHRNILLELAKFMLSHQLMEDALEYHFLHWHDDKSLVVGATKKTIKAAPLEQEFFKEYLPEEEATRDFGLRLLNDVFQKDQELNKHILPKLENWDAERLAALDLILLKMATAEFLSFPSIPTKVTLNEYVEIAKLYSTDKSKEFVNGILDRIMKALTNEGLVNKTGRGLKD